MGEPIQVGGPQPDGRRRLMFLIGGAGLLILAVLVLPGLLFGGGGGAGGVADDLAPPPSGGPPAAPPTGDSVPETVEAFSDKDPFEPLVDITPASTSDSTIPGVDETVPPFPTDTVPPGDGSVPPDDGSVDAGSAGDGASGDGTTPTTAPAPPPRQPDRVAMLEVFTDPGGQVVATIRVNDVVHQVAEGDEFAGSYRVLSLDLDARCGELLFGDERFGLCEGDETLK